jgi:DNA-binding PucR family transcriptional regulator
LKSFIETTIGPAIAYDEKRNTQLAETLRCYMDGNQNANDLMQQFVASRQVSIPIQ